MHITSIRIENYMSYYGTKSFSLSPGLNLILGDNGTGKTKFFEAIHWLLIGGTKNDLLGRASHKALYECEMGEEFRVAVKVTAEQWGKSKNVERSFVVRANADGGHDVQEEKLLSIQQDETGRRQVSGTVTLDELFPPSIRRYLLFRGESALNIFDNPDALNTLISTFSKARYYPTYSELGAYLLNKAQSAVDRDHKTRTKDARQFDIILADIKRDESELQLLHKRVQEYYTNRNRIRQAIQNDEKYVHNAQRLEVYNTKIENFKDEISKHKSRIKEEYTTSLFDEKWLLCSIDYYRGAFSQKVNHLEKIKRKKQRKFSQKQIEKKANKLAEQKAIDIAMGLLPLDIPGTNYVKDMLRANLCGVCNSPAGPGTEARAYIEKRLRLFQEKKQTEAVQDGKEERLYKHNFLRSLLLLRTQEDRNGSINIQTRGAIEERLKLNNYLQDMVTDLEAKCTEAENERNKILGSSSAGQRKLQDVAASMPNNYQRLRQDEQEISALENQIEDIRTRLRQLQEKKDDLAKQTVDKFLINTLEIITNVDAIFRDTHERLYDEFVDQLRERSNEIFQRINVDSFTGKIVFIILKKNYKTPQVRVKLVQHDGQTFSANQSLVTTMHMAILFAIANLAEKSAQESYPMFFDAPTSSFGEAKTQEFLNIVSNSDQQRIVIFYDFIGKNENGDPYVKREFASVKRGKAFLLRLAKPFDRQQLHTIDTLIEEV